MKRKNLRLNILIVIAVVFLVGCSNQGNKAAVNSQGDSAQSVVEKNFQYKNEKNKDKLLTTLTEQWNAPNVVWGFENLDSIKIISIKEEKSEEIRNGYLKYGRGSMNGTIENNLKVYKVKYKVKYKNDRLETQGSGTYDCWYFLIRKDENSPWLIDDSGV